MLATARPSCLIFKMLLVNVLSSQWFVYVVKDNVFPYSLQSAGPGADPGVQTVSPQVVTVSHPPGNRLPLLSARPAVTSVAFIRWRHP